MKHLRGKRLGGQFPLQVVATEDVFGLVHDPRPGLNRFPTQGRQTPVLSIGWVGDGDLPQATDLMPRQARRSVLRFFRSSGWTRISL